MLEIKEFTASHLSGLMSTFLSGVSVDEVTYSLENDQITFGYASGMKSLVQTSRVDTRSRPSFSTWDSVSIGRHEDGRYFLFPRVIAAGHKVTLDSGHRLDIPESELRKVLDLFANSSDGRAIQLSDVESCLLAVPKQVLRYTLEQVQEFVADPANVARYSLTEEKFRTKITGVARSLRNIVRAADVDQPIRSSKPAVIGCRYADEIVYSSPQVRHLFKDTKGFMTFGKRANAH